MSISKLKNFILFLAAFVTVFFFVSFPASKETIPVLRAANIVIKTTVSPRLNLKILYQMPEITITQHDIRRGYLELPSASLFEVESNNPNGYLLSFEGSLGPFREIHIQGLDNPAQLEYGNAFILQPYNRQKKVTIELSYRGILSENTKPGTYSWPFSISAQPVEHLDYRRKKR